MEPDQLNPQNVKQMIWDLPRMPPVEATCGVYILFGGAEGRDSEEVILGASLNCHRAVHQYRLQGTKFTSWAMLPTEPGRERKLLRHVRAAMAAPAWECDCDEIEANGCGAGGGPCRKKPVKLNQKRGLHQPAPV